MTRPIKGWLFVALAGLVMPISLPAHARAGTTAARTQRTPPPAAAPANLTATAGNARVVLAWEPVEGATGYGIVRGTAGVWEPTPFANVPRTTYTHAPLANGTAYSYKVAAYNRGGLGPLSNEVSATPMAPPAGLTAVAGDRQATLSWQASAGAVTYSVFRSTSSVEASFVPVATDLGTLTIVETGLTNGTTYYYRVRAVAAGGTSALSARVAAKPLPPPPASAPENVVATAGNASAMLTWDPVEGASSYRIFRKTTGAFNAVPVTKVTATTFKNAWLTNGTTYSFRVTAYNMGGDGPFSAVVTVTPVAPSKAPSDVTAAAGARLSNVVFRTTTDMRWLDVDGSGRGEVIQGTSLTDYAGSVAADGDTLLIMRSSGDSSFDLHAMSLKGAVAARPLLQTSAYEGGARFSPDNQWISYVSNESGRMEVYVRPYPGPDRKWQVSTQGGTQAVWNRNGKELFYRSGNKMMAVEMTTKPDLALSEPRVLFEQPYAFGGGITIPNYDVSADGQRFVMVKEELRAARLNVILNWFEELKTRVPVR